MANRKITWTKDAVTQLNQAIAYIRKKPPQNADDVKNKFLDKVNELTSGIVVHRKDPLKENNDRSFLYFVFLRYRITYQEKNDEVFVVRIRHTSMEPKSY